MPYLLTKPQRNFNFHAIFLHFALLDINNLFTTLDYLPVNYVRKGFLVPVIVPRKKYKNEKALLQFEYRFFFNFCYLHGKIKMYVVLTRRSMDLDAVTHFSDSLLVMFSVTSRRDRPKRRPSWSIFLVHSPFRESLHEGGPHDKISESCDRRVNGKRPLQFYSTTWFL